MARMEWARRRGGFHAAAVYIEVTMWTAFMNWDTTLHLMLVGWAELALTRIVEEDVLVYQTEQNLPLERKTLVLRKGRPSGYGIFYCKRDERVALLRVQIYIGDDRLFAEISQRFPVSARSIAECDLPSFAGNRTNREMSSTRLWNAESQACYMVQPIIQPVWNTTHLFLRSVAQSNVTYSVVNMVQRRMNLREAEISDENQIRPLDGNRNSAYPPPSTILLVPEVSLTLRRDSDHDAQWSVLSTLLHITHFSSTIEVNILWPGGTFIRIVFPSNSMLK